MELQPIVTFDVGCRLPALGQRSAATGMLNSHLLEPWVVICEGVGPSDLGISALGKRAGLMVVHIMESEAAFPCLGVA
jgi:hypothetical protein